jgi:hypothetical protein
MNNRAALWIVFALALAGSVCAWFFFRRASSDGDARTANREDDEARSNANARSGSWGRARDDAHDAPSSGDPPLPVVDRQKRDALRSAIWRSLGQDIPDAAPPTKVAYVLPDFPPWSDEPGDTERGPGIEPKYIQDRVHNEFFPLARKCYGDMSERIADAGGSVVLAFNIVGNKNIGGIVEQVDVLNKSTLRDPEFIDCMRESFLGVTFPPPEGGGTVSVEYPIVFSPDEPDE